MIRLLQIAFLAINATQAWSQTPGRDFYAQGKARDDFFAGLAKDFLAGQWPKVFGAAMHHRHLGFDETANNERQWAPRILEMGALLRHCQWEVLQVRLEEARSLQQVPLTAKTYMEHVGLLLPLLQERAPEVFAQDKPGIKNPHQGKWPVAHDWIEKISNPQGLWMKVEDQCPR